MSQHYENRAKGVVDSFLGLLEEEARSRLKQENIDELCMLIESAISTAVLAELEAVADEISDLSVLVRRRAERYDAVGTAETDDR